MAECFSFKGYSVKNPYKSEITATIEPGDILQFIAGLNGGNFNYKLQQKDSITGIKKVVPLIV